MVLAQQLLFSKIEPEPAKPDRNVIHGNRRNRFAGFRILRLRAKDLKSIRPYSPSQAGSAERPKLGILEASPNRGYRAACGPGDATMRCAFSLFWRLGLLSPAGIL